ncbi:bacteriochlorophyll 4-vinyl reductase [Rhodobacteraceae bacterium CCMM004]|nr:bacteriochlorophyll 4-vinyl reductase [Rhodobacteraceae bacterium CCMM004]
MLDTAAEARVGPNALIQMDRALTARLGDRAADRIFAAAGVAREVPGGMVPQAQVRALFDAVAAARPDDWPEIAAEAGRATGDYILAHRIPAPARALLGVLPAGPAARLLLGAVARHAWTFAGSGTCRTASWPHPSLTLAPNPLAMPGCPWHTAVFARLFGRLAGPRVRITHTACCALGAAGCTFDITFEAP